MLALQDKWQLHVSARLQNQNLRVNHQICQAYPTCALCVHILHVGAVGAPPGGASILVPCLSVLMLLLLVVLRVVCSENQPQGLCKVKTIPEGLYTVYSCFHVGSHGECALLVMSWCIRCEQWWL